MNSFKEVLRVYNNRLGERRGCIKAIESLKEAGVADVKRDLHHPLMPVRILAEAALKLDKDIEKFENFRVVEESYIDTTECEVLTDTLRTALAALNQECSKCDGSGRCDAPQVCPTWQAIHAIENVLPKRRVEEDEDDCS